MKRFLLSLLSLALLGLPSLRAKTHKATLYMDNTGPLSIEVDGLRYFEQNNTQSGPGYGYPIFSDAANESNFLGGFSYGLTNKLVCYGEPVPGRKITVRARYNSRETFDSETGRLADAALVLMITPVRIAYARNKGENWAHAIEKKIVFKESGLRPSGETFVLEATLPYDDSMNGAIISVRAAGNTRMEFGTITVNVVGEFKETTTVTTEASETPGEEEEGSDIPWVYIVPGAIVGGWLVSKIGKKKPKKPKTPKTKKPKEQKKKEPSSFRMILWKNCGDTLYFGDPPVLVGARIEEITPDGQRIERPDLTAAIRISGKENALVEKLRMEGKYRKADVTPTATITREMPETATVSFVFEGEQGRFVNNLVFKVEGESGILVDAGISFAAGQGKTLEMGFALLGALKNAERIQIKLSDGAQEHFSAQLEQSGETPFIFNIKLTEYGDADQMAGTTEKYYCTIEAYPPGKEEPVKETFDIYRIHLGLRLEVRALKGYLVELESTPDHDIIPPKDSKRRKKYAESRVDWQLVVVDEQQDGQIRSVYPDAPPVFTFEDDFQESMLFTARDDSNYIPLGGELVTYEGRFYRDYTGESIPSLADALKFEYTSIGHMPDGGFWGIIRATEGYLTSPNRSHVKVKMSMTWHGQTFTQEVRVPLISQPLRSLNNIPVGMDVNVALKKWDTEDENRQENLREIQRNICWDARFQELRPMFYKVTVMLEGFGKAFGYDEEDYKNVMDIYRRFRLGEIGSAFANRATVSPDTEDFDAMIATITTMNHSVPVIALRIGLGLVTGGASEIVLTPLSAMAEMKEYVDKGGDSVFGAFAQASIKVILWEGVFYVGGKAIGALWSSTGGAIKRFLAGRNFRMSNARGQAKIITEAGKKAAETTRVSQGLSKAAGKFNSAKTADQLTGAAKKAQTVLKKSESLAEEAKLLTKDAGKTAKELATEMGDDAIKGVRGNASLYTKESLFAEEAAKRAREDGQKLVDEFRRVMNNPTATPDEVLKATLALQGNKTAQNILRNQPSDLLRANFNAQMQQLYNDIDPIVIKELQNKMQMYYPSYRNKPPEVRVFKGATGNAGDELRLGRKIGADRDVTYQFKASDGKWYDINEDLAGDTYAEVFNKIQYKFVPKDYEQMMKTLKKADQAVVHGRMGAESYGDDLYKIIDPTKQTEKLGDPERIAKTFIHKCEEWIGQGKAAKENALLLKEAGHTELALSTYGYGDALIEEGVR